MRVGATVRTALIVHRCASLLFASSCFVPGASVRPRRFKAGGIISQSQWTMLSPSSSAPYDSLHALLPHEPRWSTARRAVSSELPLLKGTVDQQVVGRAVARLRGGAGGGGGSIASGSPPLSSWIGPALSCGLSYALYNLFIKRASSVMDPMLGGVLLQCVAAAMGTVLWRVTKSAQTGPARISRGGIGWSVAAGVAVGLAEILSFVISSRGVPAMKSIPIVVGGSVWFGTVLAAVWLRERVTWRGWVGVVLISIGVALVGMDPSSSAASH